MMARFDRLPCPYTLELHKNHNQVIDNCRRRIRRSIGVNSDLFHSAIHRINLSNQIIVNLLSINCLSFLSLARCSLPKDYDTAKSSLIVLVLVLAFKLKLISSVRCDRRLMCYVLIRLEVHLAARIFHRMRSSIISQYYNRSRSLFLLLYFITHCLLLTSPSMLFICSFFRQLLLVVINVIDRKCE